MHWFSFYLIYSWKRSCTQLELVALTPLQLSPSVLVLLRRNIKLCLNSKTTLHSLHLIADIAN